MITLFPRDSQAGMQSKNIPDVELTSPQLDEMIQILPAIEDPYEGASLLWFSHEILPIHPDLRKPLRIKQLPSNLIDYDQTINLPFY